MKDLACTQYFNFNLERYLDIPSSGLIEIDCDIDTTRGKCYCANIDLILRTQAFN